MSALRRYVDTGKLEPLETVPAFGLDAGFYVRYLFVMYEPRAAATFDFAEALTRMKLGECVARLSWKGDGRHLFIWRQSNGVGFIRLSQYYGHMVEWRAHDGDLLADDWVVHATNRRG